MSGLPADEGTFWGKPQLFANRVYRIYVQAAVELGYERRSSHAEPTANDAPKTSFARIIPEPPATPEKKTMGRPANSQIKVLDAVKSGHTTRAAIHKATGLPPSQVRQSIARMMEGKRLTSIGDQDGEAHYDVGPRAAELTGHALCGVNGAADAPKPRAKKPKTNGSLGVATAPTMLPNYQTGYALSAEAKGPDDAVVILEGQLKNLDEQAEAIEKRRKRLKAAIAALEGV